MALIKCDECGRQISDRSQFCPGCGFPTHLNKHFHKDEAKPEDSDAEKAKEIIEEAVPVEEIEPEQIVTKEVQEVPATESSNDEPTAEVDSTEEYDDEEPVDEESNYKKKVILFIAVFAILAALAGGLYLYENNMIKTQPETTEEADTVEEATLISIEPEVDTITFDTLPATSPAPAPVVPKTVRPAAERSTLTPGEEPTLAPRESAPTPSAAAPAAESAPAPESNTTEN